MSRCHSPSVLQKILFVEGKKYPQDTFKRLFVGGKKYPEDTFKGKKAKRPSGWLFVGGK
jgi:hypothetical protein